MERSKNRYSRARACSTAAASSELALECIRSIIANCRLCRGRVGHSASDPRPQTTEPPSAKAAGLLVSGVPKGQLSCAKHLLRTPCGRRSLLQCTRPSRPMPACMPSEGYPASTSQRRHSGVDRPRDICWRCPSSSCRLPRIASSHPATRAAVANWPGYPVPNPTRLKERSLAPGRSSPSPAADRLSRTALARASAAATPECTSPALEARDVHARRSRSQDRRR